MCILEYYVLKGVIFWVKVKMYSCFLSFVWFLYLLGLKCRIYVCNGFLFVFFFMRENFDFNVDFNGSWSVDGFMIWLYVSGVFFFWFFGWWFFVLNFFWKVWCVSFIGILNYNRFGVGFVGSSLELLKFFFVKCDVLVRDGDIFYIFVKVLNE